MQYNIQEKLSDDVDSLTQKRVMHYKFHAAFKDLRRIPVMG